MAGRFRQLTAGAAPFIAAALALLPGPALAALSPSGSPTPAPAGTPTPPPAPAIAPAAPLPPATPPKPKPAPTPDAWDQARRYFEQLSPDQQDKFRDNLEQWKSMTPEEQELYRDRELFRREKIAEEIEAALKQSGLKLDDDQREVFALRYTQERRKIEEQLHKEEDQKRQAMVSEMMKRLKVEFAAQQASPSPSPGKSP